MFENEIIEFCIHHEIKVEQYFFMWLLIRKDWKKRFEQSLTRQYLEIAKTSLDDIEDLELRGFVTNLNKPPKTLPELFIVNEKIASLMIVNEDHGEDFWNAYPATFPLSNGQKFVARAGGDKDDLIAKYLKRINYSPKMHLEVMSQLKHYKELVAQGKINGHKISDFIGMELWRTVAEIRQTEEKDKKGGTGFGRDI